MEGVIACKYNGNITIMASGDYPSLEKLFPVIKSLSAGKDIRIIQVADGESEKLFENTQLANEVLAKEF